MTRGWLTELWRLGGLIVVATIGALNTGHWVLWPASAITVFLAWHLIHLYRLGAWLGRRDKSAPPVASGIWGEVFDNIHRLQQRDRQRKQRLAQMLSHFRQSTAAMPDASVVLGPQGEIQWFNDAAKSMLGFRARDVGQRIANLIRHPEFAAFLKESTESGSIELPSPQDEHLSLLFQVVSYGKDQRLLLARDTTLLHRLEQIRTDFIANVSHEMRTPLTVIHGYLETLVENPGQVSGDWQRPVQLMYEQSLRLQNLVNDLLVLSRLETSDDIEVPENIAVSNLLLTIQKDAYALSGDRRHRIFLDADGTLSLRGNMQELHSAFSNVIFNAVQYTPDNGEIRIRWYADAQGAHLEVKDNGIGIPEHHIPRLTERFYRVDVGRSRTTGGTGLGLAIVKHVLQRHDGQLRIDSVVDQGSTFTCDFAAHRIVRQGMEETA